MLISIPHFLLSAPPPPAPLPPPAPPCLPSYFMDSIFFFNTPLSPISTPRIFRKMANSIYISLHSFPWPLNGISLSFTGTWQGLGVVDECEGSFFHVACWLELSRWTSEQQQPLSSKAALIPLTSPYLSVSLLSTPSLLSHSFVFLLFPPNLDAFTYNSASSELFLAHLGHFSWPWLWHFATRLLPCAEHFLSSLGCSLLISVHPTYMAVQDFFSANLLAYLLCISQTLCAVLPN